MNTWSVLYHTNMPHEPLHSDYIIARVAAKEGAKSFNIDGYKNNQAVTSCGIIKQCLIRMFSAMKEIERTMTVQPEIVH